MEFNRTRERERAEEKKCDLDLLHISKGVVSFGAM